MPTTTSQPAESQPAEVQATELPSTTPRTASRARWVLPTIAAIGVLCLGLLGGILIGQSFTTFGADNDAHLDNGLVHEQAQGPHLTPEKLKEHFREELRQEVRDQLKERRDQRGEGTHSPQAQPETPSQPAP